MTTLLFLRHEPSHRRSCRWRCKDLLLQRGRMTEVDVLAIGSA
uniref:Uncharacterized protein n=1 Tax=Arundo donax TaxID=35708 RepID=A0A0A9BKF8_ARUDO